MVLKYEELINHCLEIIKTYNPIILTVDSHSDQYIEKYKRKLEDTE